MKEEDVQSRKPWFTVCAAVTAIVTVVVSAPLYLSGSGAGFEGWGAMVFARIIGYLGAGLVVLFGLTALARKERYWWVNLISIGACVMNVLRL